MSEPRNFEAEMRRLQAEGLMLTEAAAELGIGKTTMTKYARRFGLLPWGGQARLSAQINAEIKAMHERGITGAEIGRRVCLSQQAVSDRLKKMRGGHVI